MQRGAHSHCSSGAPQRCWRATSCAISRNQQRRSSCGPARSRSASAQAMAVEPIGARQSPLPSDRERRADFGLIEKLAAAAASAASVPPRATRPSAGCHRSAALPPRVASSRDAAPCA